MAAPRVGWLAHLTLGRRCKRLEKVRLYGQASGPYHHLPYHQASAPARSNSLNDIIITYKDNEFLYVIIISFKNSLSLYVIIISFKDNEFL